MEAELLRGMISDREVRIAKINRKTAEQHEKVQRTAKDLEEVSEQNLKTSLELQSEKTRLLRTRQEAVESLHRMHGDLQRQGLSLQAYASVVQPEEMGDSSYVMRMQAQLCKAMHSLGIVDHQMEMSKSHSEGMVKYQRENLASVTHGKSVMELELMNELMKSDTVHRGIQSQFKQKLDGIQKEIAAMEEQVFSDDESGSESEKEEGEDKEEKEEEEEEEEEEKQGGCG
jgi:murein L,D-transpeptidase YcbB/YkuD